MIKTHIKMIIYSSEQFAKLQVLLLRNHIIWKFAGNDNPIRKLDQCPTGIIVSNFDMYIFWLTIASDLTNFDEHPYEEVDIDFYLSTKGTCTTSDILI